MRVSLPRRDGYKFVLIGRVRCCLGDHLSIRQSLHGLVGRIQNGVSCAVFIIASSDKQINSPKHDSILQRREGRTLRYLAWVIFVLFELVSARGEVQYFVPESFIERCLLFCVLAYQHKSPRKFQTPTLSYRENGRVFMSGKTCIN